MTATLIPDFPYSARRRDSFLSESPRTDDDGRTTEIATSQISGLQSPSTPGLTCPVSPCSSATVSETDAAVRRAVHPELRATLSAPARQSPPPQTLDAAKRTVALNKQWVSSVFQKWLFSIFQKTPAATRTEILRLPEVAPCLEFARTHATQIAALRERGWAKCKDSWTTPEEQSSYATLREGAVACVTQACLKVVERLGYQGDPGSCVAFGTLGIGSDIDISFIPPKGKKMSETEQALAKALFDTIWCAAFGAPSGHSMDVELYLEHPAAKGEDPQSPGFTYLQELMANWHAPDRHSAELATVVRECEALMQAGTGSPAEKMQKKIQSILKLSAYIDKQKEMLDLAPPDKKEAILLNIARASALRITLFDASYYSHGSFRTVCSGNEGQLFEQQVATITAKRVAANPADADPAAAGAGGAAGGASTSAGTAASPASAAPADVDPADKERDMLFWREIGAVPISLYTQPSIIDAAGSMRENASMFTQYYDELLRDTDAAATSPDQALKYQSKALIKESKYLLRSLRAMNLLLEKLSSEARNPELVKALQEKHARLIDQVQDLERCKRGKLSADVFRTLLQEELLKWLAPGDTELDAEAKAQIEFFVEYMGRTFSILKIGDTHLDALMQKSKQKEFLLSCCTSFLEIFLPAKAEDPTFSTAIDALLDAAVGLEFTPDLQKRASAHTLDALKEDTPRDIIARFEELFQEVDAEIKRDLLPALSEAQKLEERHKLLATLRDS